MSYRSSTGTNLIRDGKKIRKTKSVTRSTARLHSQTLK